VASRRGVRADDVLDCVVALERVGSKVRGWSHGEMIHFLGESWGQNIKEETERERLKMRMYCYSQRLQVTAQPYRGDTRYTCDTVDTNSLKPADPIKFLK
jgi:hypothetical protein